MDELERKIAILLQEGTLCGPKISEIAKKLGKSSATVFRKIKEMEKDKIVKEYSARLDPSKLGKEQTSLVLIQMNYPKDKKITHEEFLDEYIDYFKRLKEVQEIHIPVGTWDVILKVKTKDMKDQYRFISEKIMPLGNILRMESMLMMKTLHERSYVEPE